ncbi:hypothetical protein HK105_204998 [Polyrhizophydium stewartii]|uniref:Swiss Army Knife 2H phosphoesterase domain-containing protein n=1 Tax=Polyrhizophydium stewartii TaxID=2732419 RepID=A0ABR4N763_9FUNG
MLVSAVAAVSAFAAAAASYGSNAVVGVPPAPASTHFKDTYYFNTNLTLSAPSIPYLPHRGDPAKYGSYVQLTVDFGSVLPIFQQLNATYGPLTSRGEAHITVITPPEFLFAIKNALTIEEVEAIVLKHNLQSTPFRPVCVARQSQVVTAATSPAVGKRTFVYNILVDSPGLYAIRREVQKAYIAKGGDPSNFDYIAGFYPHITLGFETNDWFPEDHAYKTYATCFANILPARRV